MTADVSDIPRVRPRWLRPGAIVVTIGLHLSALFVLTVPRPALPSADDTMEITIAQGEPTAEQPPAPPVPEQPPQPPQPDPPVQPPPPPQQPAPPPPQEQPPDPMPAADPTPPDPTPPVETEAPKREVADAPAIPLRHKPKPKPRPRVLKPAPETQETHAKAETPPPSPPPSEAKQTGEQDAHDQAMHARATYAGKVLAAIRSHRPADSYNSGSVVVSFVIDAAGDMTNVTIIRSSGRHELDAVALRMVRAARPGPPPDGSFSGSTTINFVED